MPLPLAYALVALAGYLLGSIPVALLVGRARGVDLRAVGDRNPGAWNAMEQLGTRAAVPVFLGDALKGAAAAAIGVVALGATGAAWWAPPRPCWATPSRSSRASAADGR